MIAIKINRNKFNIKALVFLAMCFICSSSFYAQTYDIDGPLFSTVGQSGSYVFMDSNYSSPGPGHSYLWYAGSGGTITESNSDFYFAYEDSNISVSWNSSGTKWLEVDVYDDYDDYYGEIMVTISGGAPTTPTAPTVQSTNCGNTILQRGTPPSGVTWYWQSSSNGMSTSNSSSTITRTSGTVYYLRARKNSSSTWSISSSSKTYTINAVPATPATPTITNNCGSTVLTKGSAPSGITYYWQSSSSGTSTGSSSTSITRTSGTVYYLRARNNSSGCWSTARTVSYSVNAVPATPATPTITNNCGSTVLTKGSAPSGITYYWQSSSSGTSTGSSSTSITRTSGTVYYLRARNNSSGCWSTARTVSYSVNAVPATPATPTITNNCGSTVLTKGSAPSGITYYWQSSSSGTSTGSSSTSITRTSGTVYYLRARNNSSGCWSTARTVSYSVNAVPATPATPTITNNCGSTVLTKGSAPSGITYYWQSSSSGTSTGSSSTSITRTSGTVYYLRARNNSSGCWSTARTVSYSVNAVPATPATPTITNNCGSTVLTKGSAPSGITYYWQSSSSGTSTGSSSTSITRTSGTVYYLRARNNSSGCWSTARTVSYSVNAVPATPATPTITNNCGSTVLTKGSAPSGITYYWQSSSSGTSTGSSSTSITRTSGTVYYLRARNNSSGCWSTSRTVNYTITQSTTWYADTDGDGYGNSGATTSACTQPSNYVANSLDYNDTTVNIINIVPQTFYGDSDGDGFGDATISLFYSVMPAGYVTNNTDQCPTEYGTYNGCDYTPVVLSDENYIYTRSYQEPMSNDSEINQDSDIIENITYFDGLGRPMQSIGIKASGVQKPKPIQTNINEWDMDWEVGSGSTAFYNQNGATSENNRIEGTSPFGEQKLLWECGNDTSSDADGGWNTDYFSVDKTASYRYTVWVKRTASQNGTTYHGTQSVDNLSGGANGNPYFWAGDLPNLNQWYLLVGVIHPYSYSGGDTGVSGVYDTQGNRVIDGTEYKWRSDTSTSRFRSYLYYSTDTAVRQYFFNPIVQKVDGNETSINEIVGANLNSSPKDIITHIGYDGYGRQDKDWLPYHEATGNLGSYRGDTSSDTEQYYQTNFTNDMNSGYLNPFSEKELEASPLSRVFKQAAPGYDWRLDGGNEIEFDYEINTSADNNVRIFSVTLSFANNTYTPTLAGGALNYDPGELYKTVTKDENHSSGNDHTTEEFKDKQGRVILKRTYESGVEHDTYYVYDDYGNLTYVLPPKMNASESNTSLATITSQLNDLGYQYVYDYRNRLVEKRIPGKGWEYIVYDNLDRPVLTQDANQRVPSTNEWLFTKYDALGRVIYTGLFDSNSTRPSLQTIFINKSAAQNYETKVTSGTGYDGTYYDNDNFPDTSIEVLTVNYYDDYSFNTDSQSLPASWDGQTIINYNNATGTKKLTKGLATGSRVKVLDEPHWITTVSGYDVKGRPIYIMSKNSYLGTSDIVKNTLSFIGAVDKTVTEHDKGIISVDTEDLYTYDHVGRLTKQTQELNNTNILEVIVENNYDELGQLESKDVGGKTTQSRLQSIDYTYNVRGWLKQINDPSNLGTNLFGFKINYNTQDHGGNELYNGNIAETEWKTANTDNSLKWYTYSYDALNRITDALSNNPTNYNLGFVDYDKNGNILHLERNGHRDTNITTFGLMDDLTYSYEGNQLKAVDDHTSASAVTGFVDGAEAANEYTYDANGNMLTDANKGISTNIQYNHLNLPTQVALGGGNISYIYDATGIKLEKRVTEGAIITKTFYAGNHVYEKIGSATDVLKFFNHPEGYVDAENGYDYVYQYKDHLGNVRLSYKDSDGNGSINASTEILEENNYYPFGLKHKGYNSNIISENKYQKYNGKEFEEALGLDMYEMDWRGYDAAIGRFSGIDPFAELYPQLDKSPYAFAWNNPIIFNDPSGLCPDCPDPSSASENDIYTIGNGSQYIFNGTEWEKYTVEELDEVVVNGTSGGGTSSASSSGEVSQGFVGPGLSPIVPLPGTQPVPSPTTPKVGPGGGNVGLALLAWAVLVDTAPHPDDIAKILDPADYKNKGRDETSVMRFQFQTGTENIASTVARNSAETGVTVNQAQVGLGQLYNQQYRKVMTSFVARAAMARLHKKIAAVRPYGVIAGTRTTLQEKFIYQGKVYRFDAESIIGHNLRQ